MAARKQLTLRQKQEILIFVQQNPQMKRREVAKRFSLAPSTLSGIITKADQIKKCFHDGKFKPDAKRLRKPSLETVDAALLQWFSHLRSSEPDFPISGEMILQKAVELASLDGCEKPVTPSWVHRWKVRHGIVSKRLIGEASSVHVPTVDNWISNSVPLLICEFPLNNIFNVDESGLFWKLLPNYTMAFKKEQVRGGKSAKNRVTVLVGASATGEKLPLMVIGRSKSPRCFPKDQSKLPVTYRNNTKSWMTGMLFTEWVHNLDDMMQHQDRKILLVIDNCPAHPDISDLKNVTLEFLPPNTTSMTQPMDMGVIKSLKHHYRKALAKKRLLAYEAGIDFSFDLLKCLELLKLSWASVSETAIANCFKKVGFMSSDTSLGEVDMNDGEDNELDDVINELRRHTMIPDEIDSEVFVTIDDNIPVAETPTDEDLLVDEEEIEEVMPADIPINDATKAIDTLHQYLMNAPATYRSLLFQIESFIEANVAI